MRNNVMALVMACGLAFGSGCSGFAAGLKHTTLGTEVTDAEQHKTGYDFGVMVGNLLIAGVSYGSAYLMHGKKNTNGALPGKDDVSK